jgi:hypothetical protein
MSEITHPESRLSTPDNAAVVMCDHATARVRSHKAPSLSSSSVVNSCQSCNVRMTLHPQEPVISIVAVQFA